MIALAVVRTNFFDATAAILKNERYMGLEKVTITLYELAYFIIGDNTFPYCNFQIFAVKCFEYFLDRKSVV